MLKKTLIALVVLSFLALTVTPAFADEPVQAKTTKSLEVGSKIKAHGWPVEFAWRDVECFKVPVYMKVAMYIEFPNEAQVKKDGIELKQTAINEYIGYSSGIEILCNVAIKIGARLELTDDGKKIQSDEGKWTARMRNDQTWGSDKPDVAPTGAGPAVVKYIAVRVKDPKLLDNAFDPLKAKKHVADAIVRVKPNIEGAQWDP